MSFATQGNHGRLKSPNFFFSQPLRDVNKDVPDNPDKLDVLIAAMGKFRQTLIPLTAEVAIQVGFK